MLGFSHGCADPVGGPEIANMLVVVVSGALARKRKIRAHARVLENSTIEVEALPGWLEFGVCRFGDDGTARDVAQVEECAHGAHDRRG